MKRKVAITLITIAGLYVLLCVFVFFVQDAMLFPGTMRPGSGDLEVPPNVTVDRLTTESGIEYRIAIGEPPDKARGVLLFFLGNGEDLESGVNRAAQLAEYGFKTLVTEYPGYGESQGSPGYESVFAAAETSAAKAREWAEAAGIPVYVGGQSLGTFSAVHLAANGHAEKLLLVSPPTSIRAAGKRRFPYLPISLLLRHPFDNLANAGRIEIPTLIIHGDHDGVVPFAMGERLRDAIAGATFHTARGHAHNDLDLDRRGPLGAVIAEHFK